MRSLILMTTHLVLTLALTFAGLFMVDSANAQEEEPAVVGRPDQGAYIYVGTGFSIVSEQDTDIPLNIQGAPPSTVRGPDQDIQYEDGPVAEFALGYRWSRHFRSELNTSYRQHNVKDLPDSGHDGDIHAIAAMANVFFDYPVGSGGGEYEVPMAVPYVGVGLGVLWTKPRSEIDFPRELRIRGESVEFAWNVLLGVEIPITYNLGIEVGYRYLEARDHRWTLQDGGSAVNFVDGSYLAHEGRFGFRYGF